MTDATPPPNETRTTPNTTTDSAATDDAEEHVILYVEPDPESAELLSAFTSRLTEQVQVWSVDRLDAALDAVDAGVTISGETVPVDCVVTEQRLPASTGVTLVKRLRAAGRDLPVVFYTTCPADEARESAFDAGADAYFEKRSDSDRHRAVIDRAQALVKAGDGPDGQSD